MMVPKWWILLSSSVGLLGRTTFPIREENIIKRRNHILDISNLDIKQFTTLSAASHFHNRHWILSSDHIKVYFQRLDLQVDSTVQDIKDAYIRLARRYHPDAQTSEASTEKFTEVRDAYKKCMMYARNAQQTQQFLAILEEEMKELDDGLDLLKTRQVAHRQYLNFDVGPGTYSQREKTHRQLRLDRAIDNVFERQLQKSLKNTDEKAVEQYTGKRPKHAPRITQTLERLADDLIRESMSKGEFENLQGQGRPIKIPTVNVALDNTSQKLNQVLINSGLTPEWITLDKEIRSDLKKLKDKFASKWFSLGPKPLSRDDNSKWESFVEKYCLPDVKTVNTKIDKFNLLVPALSRQRAHVRVEILLKKVLQEYTSYPTSPTNSERNELTPLQDDWFTSLHIRIKTLVITIRELLFKK